MESKVINTNDFITLMEKSPHGGAATPIVKAVLSGQPLAGRQPLTAQENAKKFLAEMMSLRFYVLIGENKQGDVSLVEFALYHKSLSALSTVLTQLALANFDKAQLDAHLQTTRLEKNIGQIIQLTRDADNQAEAMALLFNLLVLTTQVSNENMSIEIINSFASASGFIQLAKFAIEANQTQIALEALIKLEVFLSDISFAQYQQLMGLALKSNDNDIVMAVFNNGVIRKYEEVLLPLHYLLSDDHDYANVVERIYRDLNLNRVDQAGNTPLHIAIKKHHKRSVAKLAQVSNLNARNSSEKTPLELAVVLEKDDEHALSQVVTMVDALVKAGGDIKMCINACTNNPLRGKLIHLEEILKPQGLAHPISNMRTTKYKKLVFMGGGIKGLAFLSAIEEACHLGLISLEDLDAFAGTSAGSLSAMLFAFKLKFGRLREIMETTNFTVFFDYVHPNIEYLKTEVEHTLASQQSTATVVRKLLYNSNTLYKCWNIFNEHSGLCHGEKLYEWICDRIAEGLVGTPLANIDPKLVTFKDLADHPNHFSELVVYGTNIDAGEAEEYSVHTYPNGCIADAVRISVGIEVLFKPRQMWVVETQADGVRKRVLPKKWAVDNDGKRILVDDKDFRGDGGLFYNYPCSAFDKDAAGDFKYNQDVLGFYLIEGCNHSDMEYQFKPLVLPAEESKYGLFTLLLQLINTSMFNQQRDLHKKGPDRDRTVYINTLDISFVDFGLDPSRKAKLLSEGKKGVHNFLGRVKNLPVQQLSTTVASKLFKLGILPGTENVFCLTRHEKLKNMTVSRLIKLYACAVDEELPYLKSTLANPNFTQNGVSALQVAEAWGYKFVAARLIACNANVLPPLTRAEILERIPELAKDKFFPGVESVDESLIKAPKKDRLVGVVKSKDKHISDVVSHQLRQNATKITFLEEQVRELQQQLANRNSEIARLNERDAILTAQFHGQRDQSSHFMLLRLYETNLRADICEAFQKKYDAFSKGISSKTMLNKVKGTLPEEEHCLIWMGQCQRDIMAHFAMQVEGKGFLTEDQIKDAYVSSLEFLLELFKKPEMTALLDRATTSYQELVAGYQSSITKIIATFKPDVTTDLAHAFW